MKKLWDKISDWWDRQDNSSQLLLVWFGMWVIVPPVIYFLLYGVGWCSCLCGGGEC